MHAHKIMNSQVYAQSSENLVSTKLPVERNGVLLVTKDHYR